MELRALVGLFYMTFISKIGVQLIYENINT